MRGRFRKDGTEPSPEKAGAAGFFAYGVGYATGAASCTAPVLIMLVMVGLGAGGFLGGILTFLIFSVSMGAMMVLFTVIATVGGQKVFAKYTRAMTYIERISAIVLIIVGLYFVWVFVDLFYL